MSNSIGFAPEIRREYAEVVPMRDGVRLATDIYLPDGADTFPVIIERTPYDRRGVSRSEISIGRRQPFTRVDVAQHFRKLGYAVVMQDVRGRYGSEGRFSKYVNEAEDGYDTYQWIVNQPWCDGRICSIGLSYGGHTQLAAACAGAPGLSAMFLDTGGLLNAFEHSVRCGGAFELKQLTWAYKHAKIYAEQIGDTEALKHLQQLDLIASLRDNLWRRGNSPLAAFPAYEDYLLDVWEMDRPSEKWLSPATCAERWLHNIPDIPIFLLGSWNDPYARSMTLLYQALRDRLTAPLKLVMGPWLHGRRSDRHAGEADYGPQSTLDHLAGCDFLELRHRWFDFALNGGPDFWPAPVSYYEMGGGSLSITRDDLSVGGRWCQDSSWPPSNSALVVCYPDEEGGLSATPPPEHA
ncbi:MAG: CocE/NonD family hydrolase, partial [Roseibium sp.]|uniref:CocE/NonD family hydrolase n=1 Tax=Roseibium sp. TaxID=1936156 RepID=UPI0026030AAC